MYTIALIGQTNVGKSTLFNALIERKKAIISPVPGTTRDRNYGTCSWRGKTLTIIDTGGIEPLPASLSSMGEKNEKQSALSHEVNPVRNEISNGVKKHIQFAIDEADLIFFITEIRPIAKSGAKSVTGIPISDFEREISRLIRRLSKPALLVLNKADNPIKRSWANADEWKALGFGIPLVISAVNGSGIGDLLDKTIELLQVRPARQRATKQSECKLRSEPDKKKKPIKVAIIGRPNVGKSTLLNALLGEEKVIVSSQPHTTRGPQDTFLEAQLPNGGSYMMLLVDTAGIRKRAKIKSVIEKIGVKKSLEMIGQCHIALFMLDITEPISHQDKSLIRLIIKNKKGLIMAVNKCDLLTKSELVRLMGSGIIRQTLPMASWARIIYISAKKHTNIDKIFSYIYKTNQNYQRQISKKDLNQFLSTLVHEKKFSHDVWKNIALAQSETRPPEFILKISKTIIRKKRIHAAQLNIIKKELRKKWDLKGIPIIIKTLEHWNKGTKK